MVFTDFYDKPFIKIQDLKKEIIYVITDFYTYMKNDTLKTVCVLDDCRLHLPNRIMEQLDTKEKVNDFFKENPFLKLYAFSENMNTYPFIQYPYIRFPKPFYGSCLCTNGCEKCNCRIQNTHIKYYKCTCINFSMVNDITSYYQKAAELESFIEANGTVPIPLSFHLDYSDKVFKKIEQLEKNKLYVIEDYYSFTTKEDRSVLVFTLDDCKIYMPPRVIKKVEKDKNFFKNTHFIRYTGMSTGPFRYPLFDFPKPCFVYCLCGLSCEICSCKELNKKPCKCIFDKVYNYKKYMLKCEELSRT